ncbi:MAG: TylF/MycF/NovP-related O-methyltransferase [Nitrososphaerales archaeon]
MSSQVGRIAEFLEKALQEKDADLLRELHAFAKYVPRQSITRFLARYELFKLIVNVPGCVIEAGVYSGAGVFSFAHFSAILEPVHYARKIIGFDTFEGFPEFNESKDAGEASPHGHRGGFAYTDLGNLRRAAARFDENRFIGHIPKIDLVKGDACQTMPRYLEQNPHLVVALLYLDFDLYEPTLTAIKTFLPRIPKGGIIAFDELNKDLWPGETLAAMESVGLSQLSLRRFPFDALMSYAIVGH